MQFARHALSVVTVVVAAALRFYRVGLRAPHFDEGVNGHFVHTIWTTGAYPYDAKNFHGPLYFYMLHLSEALFGHGVSSFRYATALISTGTVVLLLAFQRFFGAGALLAAFLVAISPGCVFYGRYAIHESLFVFFQVLLVYGAMLFFADRSRRAVLYLVCSVVGLVTTKETFIVYAAVLAIAFGSSSLAARVVPWMKSPDVASRHQPLLDGRASAGDMLVLASLGLLATVLFFSGFFMNPEGLRNAVRAFFAWTETGTAHKSGHEKPFVYWFDIASEYERTVLLGLACAVCLFFFRTRSVRTIALLGFGTFLAYSLIPYKTPWLVLSIVWPLGCAVGLFSWILWKTGRLPLRLLSGAVFGASVILSVRPLLRVNFRTFEDPNEPYVYVHSTSDLRWLLQTLDARVQSAPEARAMNISALVSDPWPLPYVLARYPRSRFGKVESADLSESDVVIVDRADESAAVAGLHGSYFASPFQLRNSYTRGTVYLRQAMFAGFVPSATRVVSGGAP